jgi:hypothetical protein
MSTAEPIVLDTEKAEEQFKQLIFAEILPETKTSIIINEFSGIFKQIAEAERKAQLINVTRDDQVLDMKLAREMRLDLRSRRVAVENRHKELKKNVLAEGRIIDSAKNLIVALISPIESRLQDQENFIEIKLKREEEERAETARIEAKRQAEEKRRGVNIYSGGYAFPTDRYPNGIDTSYTGFFAKTIHINDTDITSGGMMGVQIPLVFGENYNESDIADPNYDLAPRLLYYAGRRGGDDGLIRLYYSTTSATSAFDYPCAFMVNYAAPSGVDFSLSFSDEVTNYSNVTPGLFTSLYLQEFKRREIGKVYTGFAKYNRSDVSALTFREKPRIGSANFILQELTFKPSSNAPSKVVLMYDERPTELDVAKVINTAELAGASPAPGTVTGSGSGLVGSTSTTINVYASNNLYQNQSGVSIVLPANSGITAVSNTDAQVFVFQNGQKIWPGVQYTISGSTITIDAGTHFDGANYEVIVNGVRKG